MGKQERVQEKQHGTPRPSVGAQEPPDPQQTHQTPKMPTGQMLRIATLNIQGLKQSGKREEVEKSMTRNQIDILGIQETHIAQTNTEKGKDYCWYLNGNEENHREYAAMGVIMRSQHR